MVTSIHRWEDQMIKRDFQIALVTCSHRLYSVFALCPYLQKRGKFKGDKDIRSIPQSQEQV